MSDAARPEFIWEGGREYRVDPTFWNLSPEAQAQARADLATRGGLDYPSGTLSGPDPNWQPPPTAREYLNYFPNAVDKSVATAVGAPMELSGAIADVGRAAINRTAEAFGRAPPSNLSDLGLPSQEPLVPETGRVYGGFKDMEAIRRAGTGATDADEPRDALGRQISAAGSGAGSALVGSAYGKGLTWAGQYLPGIVGRTTQIIGNFLKSGSETPLGAMTNTGIQAGAGVAAEEAGHAVSGLTDSQAAKM